MSFEVTTIRPNQSGAAQGSVYFQPGRFVAQNATVKMLIAYAYGVKDFQISGGPKWIDSERFDIIGKEDESVSVARQKLPWKQYREELGRMVQAMLADRFQLRIVHRPKEASILALVMDAGGPKLVRSASNSYEADFRGGRGRLTAIGVSIAQLADALSWMPEVGSRKVVDETEIEGTFDLTLRWSWEESPEAGAPAVTVQPDAPTMFTAVREQLGLRLQAKQGPLDYIVVEQLEQPSEN
ncbi:MAG: TIGR03435 family protein [Bryobacteraceae bacterium]